MNYKLRIAVGVIQGDGVLLNELVLIALIRELSVVYHDVIGRGEDCHEKVDQKDVCREHMEDS